MMPILCDRCWDLDRRRVLATHMEGTVAYCDDCFDETHEDAEEVKPMSHSWVD